MKKILLLFFYLAQISPTQAQKTVSKNHLIKTVKDIGWAIAERYQPDVDSVKNTCWSGCVFIKFTIDKNKKFNDLDYTQGTPIFIKEALGKAFTAINIKAKTINHLKSFSHNVFILPVMIYNNQGCGFMTGWEDKNYKQDQKTKEMYTMRQEDYIQSTNSISNILNFTKFKLSYLNCILLAPVVAGGVTIY